MVTYQKVVDGILYIQQVVETKEAERVKELLAQGWSKVEAPAPKTTTAPRVPARGAPVIVTPPTAPIAAGEGTAKAKE